MKKQINLWLMAALVCGLSLGVSSCKDDDDDNESAGSEVEATESGEAIAALRWLVALTDTRELSDNWASKTYEPTIGHASPQNELNRVVVVSDLEEAMVDFASLAGIGIDDLDAPKTVSDTGVGTLTWTPSASGADNVATVDVNSPLLPRLRQIIYCTSEQTGKNGIIFDNVKGTAYYRFGDVVVADGYYWVCVRPCFEIDDKGDSHWINIFNASASGGGMKIPEKYLQTKWNRKEKYGNAPIVLPTKLPADAQHTHNLSQLIQAMLKPAEYEEYTKPRAGKTYKGLGGFSVKYNGPLFVQKVSEFWDQPTDNGYTVWEILFNCTHEQMKKLFQLQFINQGYSWGLFDGNMCKVYSYNSTGYFTRFRAVDDDALRFDVTRGIDVRAFASDPDVSEEEIPKDYKHLYTEGDGRVGGRWVIRYASGKDLAQTFFAPSPYEALPNTSDVYVYNKKTGKAVRTPLETEDDIAKTLPPKNSARVVKLHYLLAQNGYYYAHVDSCKADKTEPVAIVVGETSALAKRSGNGILETGTDYKYLLMALKSLDYDNSVNFGSGEHCCTKADDYTSFLNIRDGLATTEKLKGGCAQKHEHKPAEFAWNATLDISPERREALNLSHGFLPSVGQVAIMCDTAWDGVNSPFITGSNSFGRNQFVNMLSTTNNVYTKNSNGLTPRSISTTMIITCTETSKTDNVWMFQYDYYDVDDTFVEFYEKDKEQRGSSVIPFFLAR